MSGKRKKSHRNISEKKQKTKKRHPSIAQKRKRRKEKKRHRNISEKNNIKKVTQAADLNKIEFLKTKNALCTL